MDREQHVQNNDQQNANSINTVHSQTTKARQNPVPISTQTEDVHIVNGNTKINRAHGASSAVRTRFLAVGAVGILLSITIGLLVWQRSHASTPYSNMFSFAIREARENEIGNIEDIKVHQLNIYAQSACAAGDSIIDVRFALETQLSRIPVEVRDEIIKQAFPERMSVSNTLQDTKASISTQGKVHSYMVFWSTAYNGELSPVSSKYTTCLMLSSIEFFVAEQIAGYEKTQGMRQVATEPCKCGFFRCEVCPVLEHHTASKPIFKRYALTIKQHMELHRWMVKQATQQAMIVLGKNRIIGGVLGNHDQGRSNNANLKWHIPNKFSFLGNDGIKNGSVNEDVKIGAEFASNKK